MDFRGYVRGLTLSGRSGTGRQRSLEQGGSPFTVPVEVPTGVLDGLRYIEKRADKLYAIDHVADDNDVLSRW